MSSPRPKILTEFTVPTGGWTFKIYISNVAQFDTPVTCTIAAGTYFMRGDNQADDFLFEAQDKMTTALHVVSATLDIVMCVDPDTHKITIQFDGSWFSGGGFSSDVKMAWTECTQGLCDVLGFDSSADDTFIWPADNHYPYFVADWHHAYGWYADEDGQLRDLLAEDTNMVFSIQSTSISGDIKTQYFGDRYTSACLLQYLERQHAVTSHLETSYRTKVYSGGKGYTEAPVYPYNRNEPLECWWHEAREGKRFCVYRNGQIATLRANDQGTWSAVAATTITDAGKSWLTDPQRWDNLIAHNPSFKFDYSVSGSAVVHQNWHIASNTATVITVTQAHPNGQNTFHANSPTYYLFDHPYQTYVLDLDKMKDFEPDELPAIDRFDITIPLKRYV